MPPVHAHVQEISINRIRQQAAPLFRAWLVVLIPLPPTYPYFMSIAHDLARFDVAKLVTPELWILIGLIALGIAAARACRDRFIYCKRCLGGLIALHTLLLLGAVYLAIDVVIGRSVDMMQTVVGLLFLGLAVYWLVFSPMLAAIRLLATRLPPDDVPLLTAMATLEQTRPPSLPTRTVARAQALRAIAYLTTLSRDQCDGQDVSFGPNTGGCWPARVRSASP
jgi:hypothetical protein